MKRLVNGIEVEFVPSNAKIAQLSDRLVVKSEGRSDTALAVQIGGAIWVSYRGRQYRIEDCRTSAAAKGVADSGEIRAPMPGLIVDVLVEIGQTVAKGAKILVLEAMKTQQAFTAPFDARVSIIHVSKGDQVVEGALLATLEQSSIKM